MKCYNIIVSALIGFVCIGTMFAMQDQQRGMSQRMQSETADVLDHQTKENWFQAVRNNNVDAVRKMLTDKPYLVNVYHENGKTALHIAVANQDSEMVAVLTLHGADVEAGMLDNPAQKPIYLTITKDSTNAMMTIAELLLLAGADVNTTPLGSLAPLEQVARTTENVELAELFIAYGANWNKVAIENVKDRFKLLFVQLLPMLEGGNIPEIMQTLKLRKLLPETEERVYIQLGKMALGQNFIDAAKNDIVTKAYLSLTGRGYLWLHAAALRMLGVVSENAINNFFTAMNTKSITDDVAAAITADSRLAVHIPELIYKQYKGYQYIPS